MKINAPALQSALSSIASVVGSDFVVNFKASKSKLVVSGELNGVCLSVLLPVDSKDQWETAIPKTALQGVLGKRRGELELTLDKAQTLHFAQSTLSASFATVPYTKPPELHKDTALTITDAQTEFLLNSLQLGSLSPVFSTDTLFCAELTKKATYAACFDQLHFALVEGPGVDAPLALAFPTSTFSQVARVAKLGGKAYSLSATPSSISAWNDVWQLVLPFVQGDVEQTIASVRDLVSTLPDCQVRCNTGDLFDKVKAATAVVETGGVITLSVDKKAVNIQASSSIGVITETTPAKLLGTAPKLIKLDPTVLLEIIGKAESEFIEFGVHADRFFFVRAEGEVLKTTYGCMLSE
jgi:hypothetical protein